MPTKGQQEIAELTRSQLRDGEQILHYGEAKPPDWQAPWFWSQQSALKFVRSIFSLEHILGMIVIVLLITIGIAEMLALLAAIITLVPTVAAILIHPHLWSSWAGFGLFILMTLMLMLTILSVVVYRIMENVTVQTNFKPTKENESFENVAYIITSQRILIFDNQGLAAYPFALLTDIILSKPKNGLWSISLYTSKFRKPNPHEPRYTLLDIPEEEAQIAYEILREARDYDARVRERNMWLEAEQKRKMGIEEG
jgi:hypothetical protein